MLLVEWSRSCFYLKVSGAAKPSSGLGAAWKILCVGRVGCVRVCLHIGVCSLSVCVHPSISIYTCVHVCMFICISMCVCVHACICVLVCMYTSVCMCVYVCVREWEDALGF